MNPHFWGGFCLLLIVVACLSLVGCATEKRYLSQEEDAALREKCGTDGCSVIPKALYQQIIEYIKRSQAT